MLPSYLSSKYPTNDLTDGQYLYRSLGSFWTQLFQDKEVLKGYTLGMADELVQSYYRLLEVVKQYSLKDIAPLHKEKWLPLKITKSVFNKSPFKFEPGQATFGYQSDEDRFYAGQLFRFGYSKETKGNKVFSFTPDINLQKFGVIANRIIAPSLLLTPGVDVIVSNGVMYFNTDLFNNAYIPRAKILNDAGKVVTYTDNDGNIFDDEFIVLWLYQAEVEDDALYDNFGILLDIRPEGIDNYKTLLEAAMNLAIEGPTMKAIKVCLAAIANTPVVIETFETVEDVYTLDEYKFVITDKNAYRVSLDEILNDAVVPGAVMYAGDVLTNSIEVVDTLTNPVWWKQKIHTNKLAFASHVFAANIKHQLFFENAIKLVTYTEGVINFPVLGSHEDVEAFQAYINQPDRAGVEGNQTKLLRGLNISKNSTAGLSINPVDFLFTNLIKNNTLLIKLFFYNQKQINTFFNLFPLIKKYLPPHVYLLMYINLQINNEELGGLNTALSIPGFGTQQFSMDGSNSRTGSRPFIYPGNDGNYYKDYANRLFCVAMGPYRNVGVDGSAWIQGATGVAKPLHDAHNLDNIRINNSAIKDNSPGIKCGLLRSEVPTSVQPPGELSARLPSTREVPAILLIDF